jgi:hypothetical protein
MAILCLKASISYVQDINRIFNKAGLGLGRYSMITNQGSLSMTKSALVNCN